MPHSKDEHSNLQNGTAFDALQSYIYGYPLVLMDVTRDTMFGSAAPRYCINQFTNTPAFPSPNDRDVVRPNLDTLYSIAWLDLENEPFVLSVPNTADEDYPDGRYYLMPMLDAWTNVFTSPGARTTGTQAGNFLITGPDWTGDLPKGVQRLPASPTNLAWIVGRVKCDSQAQYTAVHKIQNGMKLTPLQNWGEDYAQAPAATLEKATNDKVTPPDMVNQMSPIEFFERLANLMEDNPPAPVDDDALRHLKKIGVEPGNCDPDRIGSEQVSAGVTKARSSLNQAANIQTGLVHGWAMATDNAEGFGIGNYGTEYLLRATVALIGLGANTPEDAVYPNSTQQTDDSPYDGGKNYVLHFHAKDLPPANAFWSVTLYDADGYLVGNDLDRYKLGSTDKQLKYNDDGSLDIFIQKDVPELEIQSNWLPSPTGDNFSLTARLYWPKEPVLQDKWHMPGVEIN